MFRKQDPKLEEVTMKITKQRRHSRRGFTLLEVLLVLAILGVIAALVVPEVLGLGRTADIKATRASVAGLEQALKLYAIDHDRRYPQGGQEALNTLLEPVDRDGNPSDPYIERLNDAWGEMLYYEYPNTKAANSTKPAIWSSGPNRQDENGAGDDINNWSDLAH
jgi:general secretion pathway protein G